MADHSMTDREVLIWAHQELESRGAGHLHGVMHMLRHMIYHTPEDKTTPDGPPMNDLYDLQRKLEERVTQPFQRRV